MDRKTVEVLKEINKGAHVIEDFLISRQSALYDELSDTYDTEKDALYDYYQIAQDLNAATAIVITEIEAVEALQTINPSDRSRAIICTIQTAIEHLTLRKSALEKIKF